MKVYLLKGLKLPFHFVNTRLIRKERQNYFALNSDYKLSEYESPILKDSSRHHLNTASTSLTFLLALKGSNERKCEINDGSSGKSTLFHCCEIRRDDTDGLLLGVCFYLCDRRCAHVLFSFRSAGFRDLSEEAEHLRPTHHER